MVHKATDGVPRLINQVCDHVLLLAYAAGIRRIEPAHVEEAWADLQQLPTPWNAPAAPTGRQRDRIRRPGRQSLGIASHCGQDRGGRGGKPGRGHGPGRGSHHAAHAGRRDDGRPGDVRINSATSRSCWPTCRLNFSRRRRSSRRWSWCSTRRTRLGRPFEEEEVIADRYAAAVLPSARKPAGCGACPTAAAVAVAGRRGGRACDTSESHEELQPESATQT